VGGILAAAHLEAPALVDIYKRARHGDLGGAASAHRQVLDRLRAVDGPAAIKKALHEQGIISSPEMRPPLGAA
jgi:dihydrodipicolinate synthase/N-acetylneuraminate lyase